MKTTISTLVASNATLALIAGSVALAKPAAPAAPAKPATPAAPTAPATPAAKEQAKEPAKDASKDATKETTNMLSYTVKDIDGKDVNLAEAFKGKVVLIVNVASKCGYTRQYDGLQKLYAAKKDSGLVILGFPANDFGGQEPGSEAEIKQFCSSKFSVTFPMFSKSAVTGKNASPLFSALTKDPAGGAPKWNFTKYLIDSNGKLVARYDSGVGPDDAKLTGKIDELLAAAKPAAPASSDKKEAAKPGA